MPLLADGSNELFLSAISGWELAQHAQRGRLQFDRPITEWMQQARTRTVVQVLPITMEISLAAELLEYPHRDPTDRFILATALLYDLVVLTADGRIREWLPEITVW